MGILCCHVLKDVECASGVGWRRGPETQATDSSRCDKEQQCHGSAGKGMSRRLKMVCMGHAGKGGGRVKAAVGGLDASDGGGRRGSGGRGKEQHGCSFLELGEYKQFVIFHPKLFPMPSITWGADEDEMSQGEILLVEKQASQAILTKNVFPDLVK
ncbi:hypothetical protein TRIUR3_21754 [Triticum urartu]|uniref:Uncharacterized protein n=1 Tax=Triticum urartu TaxID=4572 RepID=M7ZSK7_TRIUA|nr:hypothetical protein TRIUR3_21754 [Triticum urartu]